VSNADGTPARGWSNPLANYLMTGQHWGELYTSTDKAYSKIQKRLLREKGKGKKKNKVVKTCGFCKETGHSRRKCQEITHWKSQLKKANRNFRETFYQEYVVEQGLSTGAILSFEYSTAQRWQSPKETFKHTTIVTDINWDSINVFALLPKKKIGYGDEVEDKKSEALQNVASFFESPVLCKIPQPSHDFNGVLASGGYRTHNRTDSAFVGVPFLGTTQSKSSGQTSAGSLKNSPTNAFYDFESQTNLHRWNDGHGICNVKVVSRAEQVLPKDWVDGYSDEMAVVFGKYSLAVLKHLGITDFIDEWATK
tara:strand:- start:884 stop:1810 length:927 start_codon:yes stop_codon:yes gene_type:complete